MHELRDSALRYAAAAVLSNRRYCQAGDRDSLGKRRSAAAQAIISSQNLEKRSHANIKHIFFRGLYIENKDILFVMRSDALLRPTIVTMFAGVVSYTLQESFEDVLFTNTISFFFMFSDIYTSLIKYENQSYGLLYSVAASRQFKLEKIKNNEKNCGEYQKTLHFLY